MIEEIKSRYKELLEYEFPNHGPINCYSCGSCHHITKTAHVDHGVTPFIIECEECGEEATSSFYRDLKPHNHATQEWYRPTLEEVIAKKDDEGWIDHVLNGGLILRKLNIPNMEPIHIESGCTYTAKHIPSGEEWVLIGIDLEGDRVCYAGHPPGIAKLSDCKDLELRGPITDEELSYRYKQFGDGWY